MADTAQRLFVSYAGPDRTWAEWVGWQLKKAGHEVELDRWDWRTGDDFIQRMNAALERADLVLAVFSKSYFARERWTHEEWSATVAIRGRLVPVAIEPLARGDIPALLAGKLRKDLHGLDEAGATAALLEAVHGPAHPNDPAPFPAAPATDTSGEVDAQRPRLPSSVGLPEVWNVRRSNPDFSGREAEMVELRDGLLNEARGMIQVLHGIGGIGKTQIALEYAHRFKSQYDLAWWIDAEQADQLTVHYTELADRLGIAKPDVGSEYNARTLLQYLSTSQRWLLIFDNAEYPDRLAPLLPDGPGHVLITSRNPDWRGTAHQINLDVFTREDSLTYITDRVPGITPVQAGTLAEDLGDLPLALAQAVGVISSGMTLERYRQLLTNSTGQILKEGDAPGYPVSLAATVGIAVDRLDDDHPDAAALLRLGAFLGPEPIPTTWLEAVRAQLHTLPGDPDDLMWPRTALEPLRRHGLARTELESFQIHRLTQAVLRDRTNPEQAAAIQSDVDAILGVVDPGDPKSPKAWPRWASLTSHLTAQHLGAKQPKLRPILIKAVDFLLRSSQPRSAHKLITALHRECDAELGPDHPDTLTCVQYLGHATTDLGGVSEARQMIEDTLDRRRRVLGEDHPDTLHSANDVAVVWSRLGRYEDARRVHEDTLDRRRRVLGEDHPDTLHSANTLASSLTRLGRYEDARRMSEDTLDRRRRVLGEDHPDTLDSAGTLASALMYLGRYEEARRMCEDTLDRRRRVLGSEHHQTFASAGNLAQALMHLGRYEEARRMSEDTLDLYKRVLGEDHQDTLTAAGNLGGALARLGRYEDARRMHEDTLDRRRRVLGEDHPDTLHSAINLAGTLVSMGRYEGTRRMLEETLNCQRRVLGEDHPHTLSCANTFATTLYYLRDYHGAEQLLKDVRTRRQRVLGNDHPDTVQTTNELARLLTAMGKRFAAQQLLKRQKPNKRRLSSRKRR